MTHSWLNTGGAPPLHLLRATLDNPGWESNLSPGHIPNRPHTLHVLLKYLILFTICQCFLISHFFRDLTIFMFNNWRFSTSTWRKRVKLQICMSREADMSENIYQQEPEPSLTPSFWFSLDRHSREVSQHLLCVGVQPMFTCISSCCAPSLRTFCVWFYEFLSIS